MRPTRDQLAGLNVALNEARLFELEIDPLRRVATATLTVLTLPEEASEPVERRVELHFSPVGRVVASLVDSKDKLLSFRIQDLADLVSGFGGQPIYGWEFFDVPPPSLDWLAKPSLDYKTGIGSMLHTLFLFQENNERRLDVCVWFDEMDLSGELGLDDLIEAGKRWWDAVSSEDPRTEASGIRRLKP